jgi:diacylglycerol kinase (ATP)
MTASSIVSPNTPALLFVNPQADGGRGAFFLSAVERYFQSQAFPFEVARTASAEGLESRARSEIASGRRLLIGMGGDGTIQGLANACAGSQAALGIIPAGGGNDFAAALGIPREPIAAAHALLRGRPRAVDLLRARAADGKTRLYIGGGGIGLDAESARFASGAYGRWRGKARYAASVLRALRGFAPLEVHVEFPDDDLPAVSMTALVAAVLNTPTYGAGFRLAPAARTDDGWLDAVLVGNLGLLEVLDLLPQLLAEGNLRIPQLRRFRARRVRLAASRPCFFHGDGEIFGPAPVEIEVIPGAVQVLAPARR